MTREGMRGVSYLTLSFLSGVIELGAIFYLLKIDVSPICIPIIGIAYQLATLLRNPVKLHPLQYVVFSIIGVVVTITAYNLIGFWISVLATSVGLQGVRGLTSKNIRVSTLLKRISRTLGFICSPLFEPRFLVIISFYVVLVALIFLQDISTGKCVYLRKFSSNILSWTMVIHQTHYFSYAYFIPYVFIRGLGVNVLLGGIAFAIGWVSYSIAFIVYGRKRPIMSLLIGHLLTAIALATLYLGERHLLVVSAAWFMSGFGGGTVYCFRDLQHFMGYPDLDLWENIGHVLGLVVSVFAVLLLGYPNVVFLNGSMIALSVAIIISVTIKPEYERLLRLSKNI